MRTIDEIIIHCSDTEKGREFSVEDIRRWHKAKGWIDCGYHFVIKLDGTIEMGRPVVTQGAHCSGHNSHSIGICYIGGHVKKDGKKVYCDTRTEEQKRAMTLLVGILKHTFSITRISGHKKYAKVACPCFDVEKEVQLGLL